MNPPAYEVNFDGLPGPTHNFAGLSFGNVASMENRRTVSNPRAAALQAIRKIKLLHDLGVKQAILPPHERPNVTVLRRLGFTGDDHEILRRASRRDTHLFLACCSSSAMWAANAATVAPSADAEDGRVHVTPANLASRIHRAIEAPLTARILKKIFREEGSFIHHPPLPGNVYLGDEGSANHVRLSSTYGEKGVQVFVHGRDASRTSGRHPTRFPARQTRQASTAVARLHQLDPDATLHVQQHPDAIDEGVFHNDVICVGDRNVLLCHTDAFLGGRGAMDRIRKVFLERCERELVTIVLDSDQIPVSQAVESYLFNSQLVTLPKDSQCLIAPLQCRENRWAKACLDQIVDGANPIDAVHYVDLAQSLRNGGGPACLRLRVVLTDEEFSRVHQPVIWTASLHERLVAWVHRHYRDRLSPDDLLDPEFIVESRKALDELTVILGLGALYDFQGPHEYRSKARRARRLAYE